MLALQALGESLVDLTAAQLEKVELPESLRSAVEEARSIRSREGRRRLLQYIGRVMRDIDPAPIRAQLDEWRGQSLAATAELHAVERWRERLVAEEHALTDFAAAYPGADLQALRAAIREARKERATGAPPRHFRVLFRLLRESLLGERL